MPEFILETSGHVHGDVGRHPPVTVTLWRDLDAFTQGYIEALFFTWPEEEGDFVGGLTSPGFADLTPETLAKILADCAAFMRSKEWLAFEGVRDDYTADDAQAGRDFWFTRCGHGVGFWDRDSSVYGEEPAQAFTALAESFGNLDAYLGDDGKVYLS